jgi:uncharacterized protein
VAYHVKTGVDIDYAHPEFLSTPLVAAILARQEAVALYLLDQGANPRLHSEFDGLTPIQAAGQAGLVRVAERLQALGVDGAAAGPGWPGPPGPPGPPGGPAAAGAGAGVRAGRWLRRGWLVWLVAFGALAACGAWGVLAGAA